MTPEIACFAEDECVITLADNTTFRVRARVELLDFEHFAPTDDGLNDVARAMPEGAIKLLFSFMRGLAAHVTVPPPQPTPVPRTAGESGECCMSRHANAVPPWTCDCPCHKKEQVSSGSDAGSGDRPSEVRNAETDDRGSDR